MRSSTNKTNRRLFFVLLAVMALNMPWSNNEAENTADLASSSDDPFKHCAIQSDGTRVCKRKVIKDGKEMMWEYTVKKKTTDFVDYDGNVTDKDVVTYDASGRLTQGGLDTECESCRTLEQFDAPNNISDLKELKEIVDSTIDTNSADLIELAETADEREREREKEEEERRKLKDKIAKCILDKNEERLRGVDKLECQIERLDDMDEDEADSHYRKEIAHDLREYLSRGNPAQRESALLFLEDLAEMDYSRTITQSARVMLHANKYKEAIGDMADQLALTQPGSQARLFHTQRLAGLSKQMQYEFGQLPQYYGASGRLSPGAINEYNYWMSALTDNVTMAMDDPSGYMSLMESGQHSPIVIPTSIGSSSIDARLARRGGLSDNDILMKQAHWENVFNALSRMDPLPSGIPQKRQGSTNRGKPSYGSRVP